MDFLAARKALLHRPKGAHWPIVLAGLALTLALALMHLVRADFCTFLDGRIYDTQVRAALFAPPPGDAPGPLLVDIDERSLARFGQWPWPRDRIARLLERIGRGDPQSVGVDIVFAEPDRTSWSVSRAAFEREYGIRLDLAEVPEHLLDHDATLARVLARGPFALAYGFAFNGEGASLPWCPGHPVGAVPAVAPAEPSAADRLFHADSAVCSLEALSRAAPAAGFINVTPDDDGVLRRLPLIIAHREQLYPSLALRTVLQAKGHREVRLRTGRGGQLAGIDLDGRFVPLDDRGQLLVRLHPHSPPLDRVSAGEVLDGHIPPERFAGRIVLVGTTAMGLEAHHTSPLGTLAPGIAMQAAVIDNLQQDRFFSAPGWARSLELGLLVFCGVGSALLVAWTGALTGFFALLAAAAGLWLGSAWLLPTHGVFASPLVPLMALAANFSLLTFLKYRREERALRQRNRDLLAMQNFTIHCLAALAETRDSETGHHIVRCQHYVQALAEGLARRPHFAALLDGETVDLLCKSAPLHDIGKIGVADRVLLKPGRLSEDEYEEIKQHTRYGREAIERAEQFYGGAVRQSFLQFGKEMAYSHHEHWDGGGYPEGLRGEAIPLSGRIMAIADVYDALICRRRYKPSFTHEEAVALIEQGGGSHFDPLLTEVFLERQEVFRRIAREFPDRDDTDQPERTTTG